MSETMMAPAFVEKLAQHVRAITLLADTLQDVEGASEVLASAAGLLIIEAAKRYATVVLKKGGVEVRRYVPRYQASIVTPNR